MCVLLYCILRTTLKLLQFDPVWSHAAGYYGHEMPNYMLVCMYAYVHIVRDRKMQAKELVWQGSRRIHKRPVCLARGRADIAARPLDEEEFVVLDSRSMRGFPCLCENWLALVDLAGDEAESQSWRSEPVALFLLILTCVLFRSVVK